MNNNSRKNSFFVNVSSIFPIPIKFRLEKTFRLRKGRNAFPCCSSLIRIQFYCFYECIQTFNLAKNEIKHRFETVQRRNAELTYIEWYENSSNNVRLSINVGLLTTFGYLPVMKNFSNHKVRIHDLSDGYEHQTVVTCNLTGEKRSSFRFVNALGKKINDDQWRDCHSKSTCILLLDTFRDRRREKTGGTRYQCYQPKPLKFSRSRE